MRARLSVAAAAALAAVATATAAAGPLAEVTIALRGERLAGTVDSGRAGEVVTIEVKECNQPFFRGVFEAETDARGEWVAPPVWSTNALVRASWKGATSEAISVRTRPRLEFRRDFSRRHGFKAYVVAKAQYWRRYVVVQRFDRRLGKWNTLKKVTLTTANAAGGSVYVWTGAKFIAKVPKRTRLRVWFPTSQARPCYDGVYSPELRA